MAEVPLDRPAYYRDQATKLRQQARRPNVSEYFREEMLRLADEYDTLATAVERSTWR